MAPTTQEGQMSSFPAELLITRHLRPMAEDSFTADEKLEDAVNHGVRFAGKTTEVAVYKFDRVIRATTKIVTE